MSMAQPFIMDKVVGFEVSHVGEEGERGGGVSKLDILFGRVGVLQS